MHLICDKTEKITIQTFVNVKKKQRPKALLLRLQKKPLFKRRQCHQQHG